jgi:AcrR family transcriptional regulator
MNKRKKKIAEHSLALFLEKGILSTSVQDIIDRAGISKGTFYNYFSSKAECVSAILEQIRYEINLRRSELLVGKDAKDPELLIEQISIFSALGEKRGIQALFEEILHSGDKELKELVLQYRVLELEWLAGRFIEVYGESVRPHAFECAVLFYGMLHHLLFYRKMTGEQPQDVRMVASSVMQYMEPIVETLARRKTAVLDPQRIAALREHLNHPPIQKKDAIRKLRELLEDSELTEPQTDLTQALLTELERDDVRVAVVNALLRPFAEAFEDSPNQPAAKTISSQIWYYLKQNH